MRFVSWGMGFAAATEDSRYPLRVADASERIHVLGVLAGADMPSDQLKQWVASADVLIAADGGADHLHALGFIPETTLGDLDSISLLSRRVQTRLIHDEGQDSTDCDKLLAYTASQGYDSITLAGVEGDLLDHVLGTLQSAAKSPLKVRFALRRGIGFLIEGPFQKRFVTIPNNRFSVIPLYRCMGVTLKGTRWPLEQAVLEPFGLTSLSNLSDGTEVEVEMASGRAFVFVETDGTPNWDGP